MTEEEFLTAIQRYVAVSAIGVTAVRGSTRGVLKWLVRSRPKVDLTDFSVTDKARFRAALYVQTSDSSIAFLKEGKRGVSLERPSTSSARRLLQLLPPHCVRVDQGRVVVRGSAGFHGCGIAAQAESSGAGPAWSTVKGLSPSQNAAYQEALRALGAYLGVAAVHLDSMLWLEGTGEMCT